MHLKNVLFELFFLIYIPKEIFDSLILKFISEKL